MAYASGTQLLVTGVETTLGNVNSPGEFILLVDLVNMAAGDVTEIRSYQTVLASGTSRVADYVMLAGAQPTDAMLYMSDTYVNDLSESNSLKFTLKQLYGTGRNYNWKIVQAGPPNFFLQVVDSNGRLDISKVAGTSQTAVDIGANLDVKVSSRMASGTVVVGTNNDKTNYQLLNNQVINISGTITNVYNLLNPISVAVRV